jgi:trk system potassium uptake protein TrkA
MNVIICGAGQVGFYLGRYLVQGGYDVTLIDRNFDLIQDINDRLDAKAVHGEASHPDVLAKAGAENADMIIAVTQSDEVNMMACEVAHALFNIPKKVARVRSQAYLRPEWQHLYSPSNLSIDYVISPELEVAQALTRSLSIFGAFDVYPFMDEKVLLIGLKVRPQAPIVQTPINLVPSLLPQSDFRILTIHRGQQAFICCEDDVIQAHDNIYLVCTPEDVSEILQLFGHRQPPSNTLLLLGGGNVGLYLAEFMENHVDNADIRLVERNQDRAEYVAQVLEKGMVLCGDALDADILLEAGAAHASTVIAVTEDDRINTLSALLAKRLGTQHAIALVNQSSFSPLVTSLGVDGIVSPYAITVSRILQYIRKGKLHSVYSLGDHQGEMLELDVNLTSLAGLVVEDIELKGELRIAAIYRDGDILFPTPQKLIKPDDRLLIAFTTEAARDFERDIGIG